jgi:hypothetical protein
MDGVFVDAVVRSYWREEENENQEVRFLLKI